MKIAIDCGHCTSGADTGAVGNGYKEQDLTRQVGTELDIILRNNGHSTKFVHCNSANGVNDSLSYRVNQANSWGADFFVSIHFNAGGGVGTETFISGTGGKAEQYAKRVNAKLVDYGYKNRGVKTGNLYVLRNTKMAAILVEVCFIDSSSDMQKYNAKNIAKAIAEGILNKNVSGGSNSNNNSFTPKPPSENTSGEGFYTHNWSTRNATIVGNKNFNVMDKNKNIISGRLVEPLDGVFVHEIFPSMNLIELTYTSGLGNTHCYIDISAYDYISFQFHGQYKNDGGETYVWDNVKDVNVNRHNGTIPPNAIGSPMFRKEGKLCVAYVRSDNKPSSGFVRYEGLDGKKFYLDNVSGGSSNTYNGQVTGVSSSLTVRNNPNGSKIGSLSPNEKVRIDSSSGSWYKITYDTSKGKLSKTGWVSSKYIKRI